MNDSAVVATDAPARLPVRLLVSLALATALSPLNSTMVSVALPTLGKELSSDVATLTLWLVTSYVLVGIVAQSPGGKLSDLLGHRRALRMGQGVFGLGVVVAVVGDRLGTLAVARVLMAAGGALLTPSAMALVRTELPPERRAHAFGALSAVLALSAAMGPLVGGELVLRFGWRALFLANLVPLGLSALLMDRAPGVRAPPASRPAFDVTGSVLLGGALLLLLSGLQVDRGLGWALALFGVVMLAGFVVWERRVAEPVIDLRLFERMPFLAGSGVIALQNLAVYGLLFQLPFFLSGALGATPAQVGRTLLPMMVMVVVCAPLSGGMSLRFGARWTVLAGALLSLSGVGLLAFVTPASLRETLPPLMLLGAGVGFAMAPCQTAALSAVPGEKSGMAAGILTTSRYLGGVIGVAVLGLALPDVSAVATVAAHQGAMRLFALALALSCAVCLGLPNLKVKPSLRKA